MVARARLSAFAFTILMLGTPLLALAPTAEATHSFGQPPTVYVEAVSGSTSFKNSTLTKITAGMRVWVNVSFPSLGTNPPAGCASQVASPTINADLSRFQGGTITWTNTAPSATAPFDGAMTNFVVGQRTAVAAGSDDIDVSVTYVCQGATADTATSPTGSSQTYTLDNSPPHITAVGRDGGATLKKIGDTFTLQTTLGATPDFSNYTIDVSQVNAGTFTAGGLTFTNGIATGTGAPPTSVAGITVTDTGVEDPIVAVGGGDANGNTIRFPSSAGLFDAQRPTLASAGFVPQQDRFLNISIPTAPAGDIASYTVVVTPTGATAGSAMTATCPISREVGTASCWRSDTLRFIVNNSASATPFASAGTYNVTFVAVDDAGNPSTPAAAADIQFPTAGDYVAAITTLLTGQSFPTFFGTVTDLPQVNVNLTIRNPGGQYWDATTGAFVATAADGSDYRVQTVTPSAGIWRYPPASGGPANPLPPASSTDGSYTLRYCATHPSGKANCFTDSFRLDKVGPVFNLTAANNRMETPGVAIGAPNATAVIRLGINDTLAGLRYVNVTLLDTVTEQPVLGTDGQVVMASCEGTAQPNCTLSPGLSTNGASPTTTYGVGSLTCAGPCHANATVKFPNAKLGTYKLNITATDWAGNSRKFFVGQESGATSSGRNTIVIGPRVLIEPQNARVSPSRVATISAFAAWNNSTSYDPNVNPCPQLTCRVTEVQFEVRQNSGAAATALGSPIRIPGPEGAFSAADGLRYYNYTATGTLGYDPANAEARAIARVVMGPGQSPISTTTNWVRIVPENAPASPVGFTFPKENGTYAYVPGVVYDDNRSTYPGGVKTDLDAPHAPYNRTIPIRMTYDEGGLTTDPTVKYEIRGRENRTLMSFNKTQHSNAIIDTVPTTARVANSIRYYFNWSNNVELPKGNYTLYGNISRTGQTDVPFVRNFSVETRAPIVALNASNPEIFGGYVSGRFNVSFTVDPGLAVFNSTTHSYNLTLRNNTRYLTRGTDWSYTLVRAETNASNLTTLDFNIVMPTTLVDGSLNELRLNVTTEAYTACKCLLDAAANNTTTAILAYDGLPGFGAALPATSREATAARDAVLRIYGSAQDNGSGIQAVQVRIVNLSMPGNGTYNVTSNSFVAGVQDMWLDSRGNALSDITFARRFNVTYPIGGRAVGAADVVTWELGNTQYNITNSHGTPYPQRLSDMPIDRSSLYRIDVRVIDNVTRVGPVNSTLLSFDATPPVLDASTFIGPSPPFTGWHGGGFFRVFAQDNNCIARVSLMGRSPSNATVGPEDFETPAGALCSQSSATQNHAWTFNLSRHPNFTSEIGRYEVWVEAADPAGNVVNSTPRTVNYTVNDTLPAVVRNITFLPDPAQAGSLTRITIDVFENHELDRVEVSILNAAGTELKNATLPSNGGNGTGNYTIETGAGGLNVPLEVGTYTVRARAIDVANGAACTAALCPYVSATLTVTAEGAPQILLDSPENNTHVNATPTIRFRALGRGIEAGNVTILAGTNASDLATVTGTFTPIPGTSGGTSGVSGLFTTAGLATGENLTVRVTATKSGIPTVAEWTFPVDADSPEADHNVTGTTVLVERTWATPQTRVHINATDAISDVTITYTTSNGVTTSAPNTYTGPITPVTLATDTTWRLEWTAADAAGNAVRGNVTLAVDRLGPSVTVVQHGQQDHVILTVSDAGVGHDGNVTVFYSYGTTGVYESMAATHLTGNSYEARLPGNASATGLRYYFVARDLLGNTGGNFTAASPHVIPKAGEEVVDLPPTVRILSPTSGAVIRDFIDLRWEMNDTEGKPLTVSIATTQPREAVLVTALTDVTSYRHNLTDTDTGAWKIVVTVSDGVHSGSASVTFTVPAGEPVRIVNNPPATVQPGQLVPFSVAIISPGKTVEKATFIVQSEDGRNVNTGTLTQARAGVYSGQGLVTQPGKYRVLVDVLYADGSQEARKDIGTFTVPAGSGPVAEPVPVPVFLVLALGALTAALAAFGAFGRWRK